MDAKNITISRVAPYDVKFLAALLARFHDFDAKGTLILFGSRAKAENRYHSDYDLLFLSSRFSEMTPGKRHLFVLKEVRLPGSEWTIQPHCYSPTEWNSKQGSLFHREISEHGKNVRQLVSSA